MNKESLGKIVHVHFIQHEIFEAPGAYLEWAMEKNFAVSFSKVYEYEPLPETIEDIDILIVMGGPQSPHTSVEDCPYFDAKAEIALIRKVVDANKIVIGVCLGAQLIGEALGGSVEQSLEKEIGFFPISLTAEGLKDDNINHFGDVLTVGHWHSDMPGLTPACRVLATSIGCPRQIVAYSKLVYGFQCHMEFIPEVIELLIQEEEDFLTNNTTFRYVQTPNEIRNFGFVPMNNKLFQFLNNLITAYQELPNI